MRYFLCLLLCFWYSATPAQQDASLKTFADKYYYALSVKVRLDKEGIGMGQRYDTLKALAAKANNDGDEELAD